ANQVRAISAGQGRITTSPLSRGSEGERAMRKERIRRALERLESRAMLAVLYVSPSGSDTNSGSVGRPWLTLQKAADSVAAGDTVHVAGGTYTGFDLFTDGTALQPITFAADRGVVINAPDRRTPDGINLEGADYIVIQGFQLRG